MGLPTGPIWRSVSSALAYLLLAYHPCPMHAWGDSGVMPPWRTRSTDLRQAGFRKQQAVSKLAAYLLITGHLWVAGVFLGLGLQVRLVRYYVVAGLSLAAGPLAALLPLTGKLANIGLFFTAVGAVILAWGVVAFVRFLQRQPLPAEGNADVSD